MLFSKPQPRGFFETRTVPEKSVCYRKTFICERISLTYSTGLPFYRSLFSYRRYRSILFEFYSKYQRFI